MMQLIPNSVLWTCLLVMIMSCKPASTRQMNSSISKDQMIEANKIENNDGPGIKVGIGNKYKVK